MSANPNVQEKFLARIMFVNQVLKANNVVFQQLFWSVMRAKHGGRFVPIRPQGAKGDGGNDGYLPADGHYFQVYGPVDPEKKREYAAEKVTEDFEKLKKSWGQSTEIRAYSFVINDKYEGVFAEVGKALSEIEKANPGVVCRPYTTGQLEDDFLGLSTESIQSILGGILPNPSGIVRVEYSQLREAIEHIMGAPADSVSTRFGPLPSLDEKIALNNLCGAWADLVRKGARLAGHVDNYFSKSSNFMKQALRDHLVNTYRRIRDTMVSPSVLPAGISIEDLLFDEFRLALLPPKAARSVEDAVEIIIGYYFEACDVFEPPASKDHGHAPS